MGEAVEGEDATVADALEGKLTKAEKMITAVDKFHGEVAEHWGTVSQRVLVYAPPISGPKQFTEDWALIDLYRDKIDWNGFKCNVVLSRYVLIYLSKVV